MSHLERQKHVFLVRGIGTTSPECFAKKDDLSRFFFFLDISSGQNWNWVAFSLDSLSPDTQIHKMPHFIWTEERQKVCAAGFNFPSCCRKAIFRKAKPVQLEANSKRSLTCQEDNVNGTSRLVNLSGVIILHFSKGFICLAADRVAVRIPFSLTTKVQSPYV